MVHVFETTTGNVPTYVPTRSHVSASHALRSLPLKHALRAFFDRRMLCATERPNHTRERRNDSVSQFGGLFFIFIKLQSIRSN